MLEQLAERIETDRVPPAELIVENGIGCDDYQRIASQFCTIGNGITSNMINAGLIKPEHDVLDVGCGLGRLARPLVDYLSRGSYKGLDTTESSVDWCQQAYADVSNFEFIFADVFSNDYNTGATLKAADYRFPFADTSFDFVWSTSLFTHLVLADFQNYIQEMSRVMRPGATCWNTYLLLDKVALVNLEHLNQQNTRHKLPFEVEGGRVRSLDNPEAQIGLYEDIVFETHEACGLEIIDTRYGPWSGRTENVRAGGQDVVIARKL
jgi:SAM-dependent methyltransferase